MENKFKELANPMPSLEVAKKLCKAYTRPLNNHAIIINAVAPMVTAGGITVSVLAQKEMQQELNKKGMMVVVSPFKTLDGVKDTTNPSAVYEGEQIVFMPESPVAFIETITTTELLDGLDLPEGTEPASEMYKKYVVMCMSIHQFSCVINR